MEMRFSGVFWKVYDAIKEKRPEIVSNKGGMRSTKTYSILQLLYFLCEETGRPGMLASVVSETMPHLKKGAIRDFEKIIGVNLSQDKHWNATDKVWTFDNGAQLEFFSADDAGKCQGPQRTWLFLNEANHISYETFLQLAGRTERTIFIDYNPSAVCWIQDNIETLPQCVTIRSTYLDNPFLTDRQRAKIELNKKNEAWWRVYGLGLDGQLEGVIYPDFEQVDEMPDADGLVEVYGLDFGYTNDPSALVRVLADTGRRVLYLDEMIYETGLLNRDIVARLDVLGIDRRREIFADCAEPKSVAEIHFAGYNCKPCYKGKEKIEQIQFIQGWTLKVTKRSVNVIREMRNYTWTKDRDGKPLNVPDHEFSHSMDAIRYAVFTKLGTFERPLTGGRPKKHNVW